MAGTDEGGSKGFGGKSKSGGGGGGFDAGDQPPSEDYGRQPPQDMAAEQSVLGGMLLSKDAIADVVEKLRPGDFYRPAHQAVYDCILDLYARGEPADAVTVAAELERRGELRRIGGAPYVHTLISTVPTAANAGFYAEIVAEKAILRRLVEAGTRIVQLGYAGADGQDVAGVVDRAQAEIYEVTERRTSEDFVALEDLLQPTMDEIDSIASRGGQSLGIPTGFAEFDELTNGLHPGQMIIVAARPGVGKALALDTPLPTPTGWTTMGVVQVGDELMDETGTPTRVVAVTEVLRDRPCYEVEFSDGSVIVADEEHQWVTASLGADRPRQGGRGPAVLTTGEIAAATEGLAGMKLAVRNPPTLQLPAAELAAPPYVLGVVAGMEIAHLRDVAALEPAIRMRMEGEPDYTAESLGEPVCRSGGDALRSCLRGSVRQRSELLAGLLDTAGRVLADGSITVDAGPAVAEALRELVRSLGHSALAAPHSNTVVFRASEQVFQLPAKVLLHKEALHAVGHLCPLTMITQVRRTTHVPVRCVEVASANHLYLAGRSMIPTHNSTLGMDFMRSCSIKHKYASVIFSLEMSRTEIVMRLLSAEAKIKLADMRSGKMSDDDWTRLARRMSEISEAPLFIDDSPNLTMMEIRAKARRLKQRHDLRLIVVDYLQLMSSGKKVESRQQEVSEFSRSLKLMAKELGVPVIAISQLNRGPEQRTDKRPQVSDLRESGCLTAATRILRADNGTEVTLGELLETGEQPLVWSLDERLRMVARPMVKVFPSGRKEVFRLRLASGKQIEATGNHPFLTVDGWIPLENLKVDDRVATPRLVPEPVSTVRLPDEEIILLAHMIGDGSCVKRQPIRYASIDEENLQAVTVAALHFGVTAVRDDYVAARCTTLRLRAPERLTHGKRNPIAAWLDGLGIFGLRSYEKFIPAAIYSLPRDQVALFLRHLWATDGSVQWDKAAGQARVYYATTSRRLADDVTQLLLRCGIHGRIKRTKKAGYRDCWQVTVDGVEGQVTFLRDVGVHGARGVKAAEVLERLAVVVSNPNVDTVPKEVWTKVRSLLAAKEINHRDFSAAMGSRFCGSTMWKRSPSRARLARVAVVLDDAEIEMLATNDVFWDKVVEVESIGEHDVYDGTVPGTHNFVADGIAVHNSLEQDADMVILLHRPDAFERDDPRGGEADLIIGKHRAGPTATITVAHQLHLSRFVDMARG